MGNIVCIVGPTASGKTALGIALAKKFNGEVVSADSRMVYKGMEIGTASPHGEYRISNRESRVLIVEDVLHFLIGVVEPDRPFTVVDWQEQAVMIIDGILKREKLPIVVGGTGLYISALVDNFRIPPGLADQKERIALEQQWKTAEGRERIVQELLRHDREASDLVDLHNPRRVIRALEVYRATGKPFTRQRRKGKPRYNALQIGLSISTATLEANIRKRVDEQIAAGLIDEVRRLKERYGCKIPPMQGLVYQEMCQYLAGELTLKEAKELICLHTRQYAKRQRTWFKKDKRIRWVSAPLEAETIVEYSYRIFSSDC